MNKPGRIVIALSLIGVLIISGWYWDSKKIFKYDKNNLIRFHVIANSNSPLDQALKYKVRDEIIKTMSPYFAGVEDVSIARRVISGHAGDISAAAGKVIREYGYDYSVTVCMGRYQFPDKTYRLDNRQNPDLPGEITLPAGDYEAVRVIIGSGRGANWWCVLFPPLCFVNPLDTVAPGDPSGHHNFRENVPAGEEIARAPGIEEQVSSAKEPVLPATEQQAAEQEGEQASAGPSGENGWSWKQPGVEYRFMALDWFVASRNWFKEFIN